jgi:DNA polymerase III epsilon subunit-like protein
LWNFVLFVVVFTLVFYQSSWYNTSHHRAGTPHVDINRDFKFIYECPAAMSFFSLHLIWRWSMLAGKGIIDHPIHNTPIAIVDFKTTGLTPGIDRVIEISVVKVVPGRQPYLAFDTLVNPNRLVAATEIHGITDDDVADAPQFSDITGD